ncbi:glycosyltransferase [Acinetobacter sp. A3]|uniref:glycosyltransferase n=1 Tax=Acinetobacter sp. A3 TaxID=2725492 RepID=UPI0014452613|nr:glycosyltransferase [Acinetobacter sp. A3]
MKKILIVLPSLGIGGVESIVRQLIDGFDNEFYFEILLFKKDEIFFEREDIKINQFYISSTFSLFLFFVKFILLSRNFNIIHAHTFYAIVFSRLMKIFNWKLKIISSEHSSLNKNTIRTKYRILYRYTDFLSNINTNVSKFSANSYFRYNYTKKEATVIYNGIKDISSTTVLLNDISLGEIFNRYDKVILFVGRICEEKDCFNLLEAYRILVEKTDLNVALFFVGDGPLFNELKRKVHIYDLEENVLLFGVRHDVNDFYKLCDLFVLSSITEGLPTVILEAIFKNKIIVSTECGGVKEIFSNNYPFLVPICSPEMLSEAMLKALFINENLQMKIISDYDEIKLKFSANYFIEKWKSIYKGL